MEIRRCGVGDELLLVAASHLFDRPVEASGAREFLSRQGHHCLVAFVDGGAVGFVTGVEMVHPDKRPEMLLYELGVDESARRRGVGSALVTALRDLARDLGLRGMWVLTDAANDAALATYRRTGATDAGQSTMLEWSFDDVG